MPKNFKVQATFTNANVVSSYALIIRRKRKGKEHYHLHQKVDLAFQAGMWTALITTPDVKPKYKIILRIVGLDAKGNVLASVGRANRLFPPK